MKHSLALYAAALAAVASRLEVPHVSKQKPQPRNCDKKKCKSCKHFVKAYKKHGRQSCSLNHICYDPLQTACEDYQKRK